MNDMKTWCLIFALFPAAALAQTAKFDGKQPIEITADSLEVQQKENQATFVGNVVAIQGDVRLKSERMTVYYASAAEKKGDEKQSIKKIDVEGNVFLATPEETASGARGDYDVAKEEIHLIGDVVLTRGASTLKGDNLTYNFASGHSIITGGTVAETGASKGKTRVRALFVPEDKKEKQ